MSHLHLTAVIAALVLGAGASASAQSIDYGSMQQLFNEPVTTSATGSPLRATDAPVDMTIISADDIKHSGAIDLPTILSRVAGVDVLNWSAGVSDLSVRGYDQSNSARLLVLINGREVYLDDYGYTSWSTLPVTLSEIRQIEVVRGPNSALFGFNAVGGVINIITYNPKYDTTDVAEVHGGAQNEVGGSVVDTLKLGDRLGLRVSAGADRQDQWRNLMNDPTAWRAHGMFDGIAQLSPQSELRVQGALSKAELDDIIPSQTYDVATYTTKSLMGTLTSDSKYGQIQVQAYVNGLKYVDPRNVLGSLDLKNEIEVASLQDVIKIDTRSTFRFAIEYRNNLINLQPISGGHIGYGVWAPSGMWNFAATSKLTFTSAVRLDALSLHRSGAIPPGFAGAIGDWSRSTTSFSANLGAVYKPTDLDTLRATYARGIQVPTLIQFGGVQAAFGPAPYGLNLAGNPDLKPAVVSNYELSFDRSLPSLKALVSAKGFFQQSDDVNSEWDVFAPAIAPTRTTSATSIYQNTSNSEMAGFEVAASGKFGIGFHWNADTTYTNVTNQPYALINPAARLIDYAATTPRYRGNLALGWSDNHWSADGFVHYVTQYDAYTNGLAPMGTTLVSSPSYATLGGRLAYRLPEGFEAALSGQNLTSDHQIQAGAADLRARRAVIFGLSKTW